MSSALSIAFAKKLLFYALIVSVLAVFGFLILREMAFFRKTETLDIDFQTSSLKQIKLITVLPKDAIKAIKSPRFESVADNMGRLRDDEQVIGVSINNDHRAYPVSVLSFHEIVDDTVGGVPIAVTF